MYVSLQRRAQKCMNLSTVNRPASRTQKCNVLLQFWAIDTTFLPRGLTASKWNLRFATVLGDRHHVFTERVDREQVKFAFRYSFGRSTPRFYREGWPRENEICVSLQFWAIDTTFLLRGLPDGKWNSRFPTVLGDRHHVFTERVARQQMKFAFRDSFGRSTPRFYREGWPRANEICVSLQFWAIDDAFLAKWLLSGWPSPSRPAE